MRLRGFSGYEYKTNQKNAMNTDKLLKNAVIGVAVALIATSTFVAYACHKAINGLSKIDLDDLKL